MNTQTPNTNNNTSLNNNPQTILLPSTNSNVVKPSFQVVNQSLNTQSTTASTSTAIPQIINSTNLTLVTPTFISDGNSLKTPSNLKINQISSNIFSNSPSQSPNIQTTSAIPIQTNTNSPAAATARLITNTSNNVQPVVPNQPNSQINSSIAQNQPPSASSYEGFGKFIDFILILKKNHLN
jgi:hypothetical protein